MEKRIKRRSESNFGLHFDFHASPSGCPRPIGETLTEEEIREICTLLRPDFLQIDCKGHPGWASYPTEVGNAMPAFKGDPLALWRKVTAEEGVALYLHYSGVFDMKYCQEHPEAAVMRSDGSRAENAAPAGPYADEVLIPQLTELALKYGADGAWVDGECWATEADFDPRTVSAFERDTGIDLGGKLPVNRNDPYFEEYREYCRGLFRSYVRHYVDAVHAAAPGFQIASNWAYTDHMPEAVSADVDFLSGDFNPENSFHSARYAGRAIAQQGRTWDLMAWNFRHGAGISVPKHPAQIMQEAASVISLGGGFQNYITQYRDGSPRMEQIRRMKPVADFIRARQDYCFRGRAVHQAAVLLSTFDRHRESGSLFSRSGWEKIMGMTVLLCDAGHSTEVVSEHTLAGHCADYPVIVVPELYAGLAPETVRELLAYADNGGSLVLTGSHTCRIFSEAGLPFGVGEQKNDWRAVTTAGGAFGAISNACAIRMNGGTGLAAIADDAKAPQETLASVFGYGKGRIGLIGADLGLSYLSHAQFLHKALIREMLSLLYVPSVRLVSCEGTLEITDLRKDGKQMIQLVNANGGHRDPSSATEDAIQPCREIVLSVAAEKRPAAFILRPEGRKLPFEWKDGRAEVRVDRVDYHEIVETVY